MALVQAPEWRLRCPASSPTELATMTPAEKSALYLSAKAKGEAIMAQSIAEVARIRAAGYLPAPPSIVLARQRSVQIRGSDANAHAAMICKKLAEIEALDGQGILVCTYDTAATLLNNEGLPTRFGRPWNRVTVRRAINRIHPQEPRRPGPAS